MQSSAREYIILWEPVSRSTQTMALQIVGLGVKAAEATSAQSMSRLRGWKRKISLQLA